MTWQLKGGSKQPSLCFVNSISSAASGIICLMNAWWIFQCPLNRLFGTSFWFYFDYLIITGHSPQMLSQLFYEQSLVVLIYVFVSTQICLYEYVYIWIKLYFKDQNILNDKFGCRQRCNGHPHQAGELQKTNSKLCSVVSHTKLYNETIII